MRLFFWTTSKQSEQYILIILYLSVVSVSSCDIYSQTEDK